MNFQNYCKNYNQKLINNSEAEKVFIFLSTPATIHNMINFCEVGLPAISGIASIIEQNYASSSIFPISDFRNRQVVGKMVKYILGFYGYTPQAGGLDERARLRNFSNSEYFKTASVYSLTNTPRFKIVVTSI